MSGTIKEDPIAEILRIVRETQQGLALMLETQAIHSEQLEELTKAATKAPVKSKLQDAVETVASELAKQTGILERVEAGVGVLLARERAEAAADADGVIAVLANGHDGHHGNGNGHDDEPPNAGH